MLGILVPMYPQAPDENESLALLARAQAGDDRALNQLFEHYHDHILLAVRLHLGARLRSLLQSTDIFQSVALAAFEDLQQFQPRGQGSFRAYLNRLVLNKIRSRARHFDARKRQGMHNASSTELEQLADKKTDLSYRDPTGQFARLEREIQKLPEDMRRILLMRTIDGLSSQEVANSLGKSDAAVRKSYSRAIARVSTNLHKVEKHE